MAQKYSLPTSGYYHWRAVSRDGFAWTEVGVVQAAYLGFVELSPSSGLLSYDYSSPVDTDAGIWHCRAGCAARRHRV